MWGNVSVAWRQSVRDYMELILDNNDVKVKQAEYDREQIPGRVLGIYCRYKERT